jgi:hypothetical protein
VFAELGSVRLVLLPRARLVSGKETVSVNVSLTQERQATNVAKTNSPQKAAPQKETVKQRPAHEVRFGRLKATVWRQESDNGPWYSVVLTRSYKDAQGNWQTSQSYGRDDLLLVAKLCDRVHSWIYQETAKNVPQTNGQQTEREPGQDEDIPF